MNLNAQDLNVRSFPLDEFGLLLWEDDPDFDYVKIKVNRRVIDSTLQVHDVLCRSIDVAGEFYYMFNREEVQSMLSTTGGGQIIGEVQGYKGGSPVGASSAFELTSLVSGPSDGEPYEEGCHLTCNGSDYAWRIQQFVHSGGGNAMYQLRNASVVTTSTDSQWPTYAPFYEYMALDVFHNTKCVQDSYGNSTGTVNALAQAWYDIAPNQLALANQMGEDGVFAPKLVMIPNIGVFTDKYGQTISPTNYPVIVGIQKTRGVWRTASITVGPFSNPSAQCVQEITGWTNLFNFDLGFQEAFSENLQCQGSIFDTEVYDTQDVDCAFNHIDVDDIVDSYEEAFGWNEVFFDDLMAECPGNSIQEMGALRGFYNFLPDSGVISSVVLQKFEEQGVALIETFTWSDFFDENYEFVGFELNLDKGLYSAMLTTQKGEQVFRLIEVHEAIDLLASYAEFTDVNIYPVPIQNDWFSIDLMSSISSTIEYEIYDVSGFLLHSQRIVLGKNELVTLRIAPSNPLPNGLHSHVFRFPDGSQKSITTSK